MQCSLHSGQVLVGKKGPAEAQLTPGREGQAAIVYSTKGSSEDQERKNLDIAPHREETTEPFREQAGHRESLLGDDWRGNT